jgi:hypothetical protein
MANYPASGHAPDPFDDPWYPPEQRPYYAHRYPEDATVEYRELPTVGLPEPAADQAGAAPTQRRDPVGVVITVVVVLVLVLCGGLVAVLHGSSDSSPAAGPVASATPSAAGSRPRPVLTVEPSVANTADAYVIVAGQCVLNEGTPENPKLRLVGCKAGTYYVIDRFDSTDDVRKCEGKPGYTYGYFYQTTPGSLDFVLCLKKL